MSAVSSAVSMDTVGCKAPTEAPTLDEANRDAVDETTSKVVQEKVFEKGALPPPAPLADRATPIEHSAEDIEHPEDPHKNCISQAKLNECNLSVGFAGLSLGLAIGWWSRGWWSRG